MHPVIFQIGAVLIPSYGALAALGVVAALLLAQHTARIAGLPAGQVWNLCVISTFAALVGARLLLVIVNWAALSHHPSWLLELGVIHHPLVGAAGALAGAACAWLYARWQKLPVLALADVVAAPLALALAFEQMGQLLAGSGYGTAAGPDLPWAVTYTDLLAMRWGGAPLGIPLHPVQAYAALGFLAVAILLLALIPRLGRRGDTAGLWLMGAAVTVYISELWRDPTGRGSVFGGLLDGPQIAAVILVLAGAFLLRERQFSPRRVQAAQTAQPTGPAPAGEGQHD